MNRARELHQIQRPVIVEIRPRCTVLVAAEISWIQDICGDIGKTTVAEVAEQHRRFEVIGEIEIGAPVTVVISPGRAVGHALVGGEAGFGRDISEQDQIHLTF